MTQNATDKNIVNNIPLIANANLTEQEKELILKNTKIYSVKKNEYILKSGNTPVGLICLLEGVVIVFQEGHLNREQIIRLPKQGGYIGYRALFAEQKYNASAMAIEDSIIAFIEKDALFSVMSKNSKIAFEIIKALASELGDSNLRIINLTQKHLRGRLAESLIFMINTYGYKDDNATINVSFSRDDIASLSNMTTSNAIRVLSQFVEEKIIEIDKRNIKILNLNELNHVNKIG